ncbi:unnamed protein product, partial [marine sediment metagenome]
MAANTKLICFANAPFFAGIATPVIDEALAIGPRDTLSEAYLDAPWMGVFPLTIQPYVAGTYPTFNTWGEIMFDATRANFRCGNDLWMG